MQDFTQLRRHLVASAFHLTMQEPDVLCVELSLDGGQRHQSIFLSELQDDDGRRLVRISTVVALADGIDCQRALRFNWLSRVGYLAIGDLDGVPYLQLCENRTYDSLSPAELDRLVLEIGGVGDGLERALSSEGDLL